MTDRTICVGDIHGCIDEFDELLKTLSYNKEHDRLILLGDLIDRGPDSVGMIRKAREMDIECLMGNHEEKFVKWFRSHGTKVDVYDQHKFYSKFSDEDISYIHRMPSYIKLGNTIAVHAGLKPNIAIEKQYKGDLLHLRYTDSSGGFVSLKKIHKVGKANLDCHFWTEYWQGPESIVYGHNVHSYSDPLIEETSPGVMCYGLDTGCCFGGKLTALILETKEIVQVSANKTYYQSDFVL